MKTAIYSPYLDTFGGGERYILTIAEVAASLGEVDLLIDSHLKVLDTSKLLKESANRFNLDLNQINLINAPLGKGSNFFKRNSFLKKYDVLVYLTDGSIFYSTAKKSILHIQSPIQNPGLKKFWNKKKLNSWDLIIYNSEFTKKNAMKTWNLKNEVVYPPVDVENIKPLKKEKYILSVGRFFSYLKDKKQEVLIDSFRKLFESGGIKGWSLHLAGSAGEGDKEYVEELREKAKGLPIEFYPNIHFKDLCNLYGESSIYWHAAGYGEDDPTKFEHFGITTVEAMAGGCVPVAIGKGGQVEIVENKKSGFLWNEIAELEELTLELIKNDKLLKKTSDEAVKRSQEFSKDKFRSHIIDILK